ncbi:flagellar biosynthetic protein FliR [Actinomycetaceae bacterium L2_0104]
MNTLTSLEPFVLAMTRVTVFLVLAPPFSHGGIPMRVRVMLGVVLAFASGATVQMASADTGQFLGRMVSEALVGAGLGFVIMLAISAVQVAGRFIDSFGGFEIGAAFDPMSQTQSGPFGRFYQLLAVVLLFSSDGYQLVILGVARTFQLLPLGQGFEVNVLADVLTNSVGSMMLAALQIAGPLVVVLFLADVGLGLLTRVAPALNAFAMGFPLKILIALALSTVAIATMPQIVEWLVTRGTDQILEIR